MRGSLTLHSSTGYFLPLSSTFARTHARRSIPHVPESAKRRRNASPKSRPASPSPSSSEDSATGGGGAPSRGGRERNSSHVRPIAAPSSNMPSLAWATVADFDDDDDDDGGEATTARGERRSSSIFALEAAIRPSMAEKGTTRVPPSRRRRTGASVVGVAIPPMLSRGEVVGREREGGDPERGGVGRLGFVRDGMGGGGTTPRPPPHAQGVAANKRRDERRRSRRANLESCHPHRELE